MCFPGLAASIRKHMRECQQYLLMEEGKEIAHHYDDGSGEGGDHCLDLSRSLRHVFNLYHINTEGRLQIIDENEHIIAAVADHVPPK